MKEELSLLRRLEEDCQSIQQSLAIIQSAQRISTFYTSDERQRLFKEYAVLTAGSQTVGDIDTNPDSALAIFRQDHPDLALIADTVARAESINLHALKLKL